jgi:hypothetical protein
VLADDQLGGDLRVGHAPRQQPEHVALAGRELAERGRPGDARRSVLREALDQAPGDRRGEQCPPPATTRTAASSWSSGASFSRNPPAPALSAS